MEKREYVKLWLSYRDYFEPYSAAEVGRLVLAMMEYRASGAEPEFSGSERFVWPAIRRDIDSSVDALESAQEAGKRGGRPKGYETLAKGTKGYETPQKGMKGSETLQKGTKGLETQNNQGEGKGKGKGKGEGISPPLSPSPGETPAFSPVLQEAVDSWLRYKHEKRQDYQPEGLRNLFGQIRNNAAKYGDAAVAEVIRQSMSSNYQGIVFDRLTRGRAATGFESSNPFLEMLEEERGHG